MYVCIRDNYKKVDRPLKIIIAETYIIESVDSISRDERDVPLTQYITNA